MEGSSRRRMTSVRLDVAKASRWTLRVMNFLVKALSSWDTCHYPDRFKILTATDPPSLPHLSEPAKEKLGNQRHSDCKCFKTHHDL